jgi:hypothetical protein
VPLKEDKNDVEYDLLYNFDQYTCPRGTRFGNEALYIQPGPRSITGTPFSNHSNQGDLQAPGVTRSHKVEIAAVETAAHLFNTV